MSAFLALDAARAAGVEVRLKEKNLVLSCVRAPPPDILDMLRRHKHSIVALLQRPPVPRPSLEPSQPWDRDEWQSFFDEWVCIAEGDGLVGDPQPRRAPTTPASPNGSFSTLWLRRPAPCPVCGDLDRSKRSIETHPGSHRRAVLAARWMREGLGHCPQSRSDLGIGHVGNQRPRGRHVMRPPLPANTVEWTTRATLHDLYETPPEAIDMLLRHEPLRGSVLEPSAGRRGNRPGTARRHEAAGPSVRPPRPWSRT